MKQSYFPGLTWLLLTISCTSNIFSEKEKSYVNNISALLNGGKITINKGIVLNSNPDSYFKYKIIIENCPLDSLHPESSILFITSMPALELIRENVLPDQHYKYVEIELRLKNSETVTANYMLSDLLQINACTIPLEGFTYGIKELNRDSLLYYGDDSLKKKVTVNNLISLLKNADFNYGSAKEGNLNGFKIDTIDHNRSVIFFTTLHRPKAEHKIEIGVNLDTKQINYFNL